MSIPSITPSDNRPFDRPDSRNARETSARRIDLTPTQRQLRIARQIFDRVADPRWQAYRKEYPRDVQILMDVQIWRTKYPEAITSDWTPEDWLVLCEVGCHNRGHARRVLGRSQARGLMDENGDMILFEDYVEVLTKTDGSGHNGNHENGHNGNGQSLRPRYASDEKRRSHAAKATPPILANGDESPARVAPADSAETPPQGEIDSADTTPAVPSRAGARPDSDIDSDSGGDKYIYPSDSGSGTGGPPLTVVECLVAEGMMREKAEARVKEFGKDRWLEALAAADYLKKPIQKGKRAGWLVDFVLKERPLPKAMIEAREKAAQEAMNLPIPVQGGLATSTEAERRPQPPQLQRREASDVAPPPEGFFGQNRPISRSLERPG